MIITEEKYCIASKSFPLRFYRFGNETDTLEYDVLRSKDSCDDELKMIHDPNEFQILKVKISYEI